MKYEQPMYEGDSQLRDGPLEVEFPAIRRLIEAFQAVLPATGSRKATAKRAPRAAIRARAQHA